MRDLRTYRGAAACAAVLLLGAKAGGQEPADSVFLRLERRWMAALATKDTATLQSLVAADFTIIGAASTVETPVADRRMWFSNAARVPWPQHEVRLLRVHRFGDVAVVHLLLSAEYPPHTVTPEGGRLTFFVTDTWARRPAGWQVVARHSSLPARRPR